MSKPYFVFLLLFLSVAALGQPVFTLSDKNSAVVDAYTTLPDSNYSFEKILADTSLPFVVGAPLRPRQHNSYWVKILMANTLPSTQYYNLRIAPFVHNTLYYFNADARQWEKQEAGIAVRGDKGLDPGTFTCELPGNKVTTLFIKMDLRELAQHSNNPQLTVYIEKKGWADEQQKIMLMIWVASITALLLFFLHNLYIYYSFRDKTVLNYLTAQIGAAIYITGYRHFFRPIFSGIYFSVVINAKGIMNYYHWGVLLIHVAVVVVLVGFVQLTRTYLQTHKTLPVLDKLLQYGLYTYTVCSALLIIVNTCFFYIDGHLLVYDNIFVLLLIAAMMFTCVVGYLRGLPNAGPFLLANMLPLAIMLATGLYHVFISLSKQTLLLPDLAIISQAVVLSIVLVARMKSIRNQMAATEQEARQLAFGIREISQRHSQLELDNQKISNEILQEKSRNELLQQKLESNQRELASSTLYIVQKNELLAGLKSQIKELGKLYPDTNSQGLQEIESILQSSQYLDTDWAKFKVHFEQVHPQFFENLQTRYPTLTKNEIRLYTYFHINLSTKEIASLMNIDPASVRQAKTRLNKKMTASEAETG